MMSPLRGVGRGKNEMLPGVEGWGLVSALDI